MPLRNELQQQIVAKHQLEEEPSFTRSPPLSINPSVIQFKGTYLASCGVSSHLHLQVMAEIGVPSQGIINKGWISTINH
jgi:hypothetical protein